MKQFAKLGRRLGWISLMLSLSACSVLEGDKIDYKSAAKAPSLEIPPDLTQLSRESRYTVPGAAVTASGYKVGQAAPGAPVAAATVGDVRIERSGTQRWLVVNRTAEQLWGPVRDFWQESGFLLTIDQPDLGILETDWNENRAKLPQDFIRSTIGKALDSLYSTAERDKFRTRLERTSGGTEIYISHRGMMEVYANEQQGNTVWQPRPSDPELEAEFLRRLMVKLGVPQEQSKALIASGTAKTGARVTTANNVPVVQIEESFDRAWRRVGLALDRTGFTVEDRDRSQGTYFVRYVEPNAAKDPSFLGKLFGAKPASSTPLKYRVSVRAAGEATTVSVLNATGEPEASDTAKRILQVIADDLK